MLEPEPEGDDGGPVVFIPHELRCPISGDLMEDPVVAEDKRSYEREMIEAWFAQCTARGQPRRAYGVAFSAQFCDNAMPLCQRCFGNVCARILASVLS